MPERWEAPRPPPRDIDRDVAVVPSRPSPPVPAVSETDLVAAALLGGVLGLNIGVNLNEVKGRKGGPG